MPTAYCRGMPSTLRTVNLGDNGRIKQIIVGLNDNNSLTYTLIVDRDNADRPSTRVEIPLSESQVDLMLRIATFR